jgi:cytochrome oxidase Cu insertion factor (SCO1/SenC/PrrC family)
MEVMMRLRVFTVLLFLSMLMAACAPAVSAPQAAGDAMPASTDSSMPGDNSMETPAVTPQDMQSGETMLGESQGSMGEGDSGQSMGTEPAADTPAWFDAQLTNVRTGEAFTINDLQGKVILVETMAQWCTNCLAQQKQVLSLHDQLGPRDDFVSLGLDIDPNEDAEHLKTYTDKHDFTWMYAVPPKEVSREISLLYGDQFLNPPSTPMLIIDRQGQAHPLPFGIKSADDLHAALQPYLDGGM